MNKKYATVENTTTEHMDPQVVAAGDHGTAAAAGDFGSATAGYDGTAAAGDMGTATVGERGTAIAGYKGSATAGDFGSDVAGENGAATSRGRSETGRNGLSVARGVGCRVKGGMGALLVIGEERESDELAAWKAAVVDGQLLTTKVASL